MSERTNRSAIRNGVLFALVFPTLVTWVYFMALKGQPASLQQSAYLVGKVIQFGFPLAFVALWRRHRLRWRPRRAKGVVAGGAFGLVVAASMLAVYFAVLKPAGFFEGPDQQIREKISGMGLTSLWKYALVGVFYALCHSFLEEYYWRWFVFRELRSLVSLPWAIAISSLGFMAHHVLVLATYFGWTSPATWLFSISVAIGGAVWAWLYARTRSLFAPWIGHCLVDAAIFALGYDLARDLFAR